MKKNGKKEKGDTSVFPVEEKEIVEKGGKTAKRRKETH